MDRQFPSFSFCCHLLLIRCREPGLWGYLLAGVTDLKPKTQSSISGSCSFTDTSSIKLCSQEITFSSRWESQVWMEALKRVYKSPVSISDSLLKTSDEHQALLRWGLQFFLQDFFQSPKVHNPAIPTLDFPKHRVMFGCLDKSVELMGLENGTMSKPWGEQKETNRKTKPSVIKYEHSHKNEALWLDCKCQGNP